MGFPFFTPIYIPPTSLKVFGPVTHEDESLESIVGATRAKVKKLVFIHHDPTRTDADLGFLAEQFISDKRQDISEIVFAREGMEIAL
jgi:hypothetical protein